MLLKMVQKILLIASPFKFKFQTMDQFGQELVCFRVF